MFISRNFNLKKIQGRLGRIVDQAGTKLSSINSRQNKSSIIVQLVSTLNTSFLALIHLLITWISEPLEISSRNRRREALSLSDTLTVTLLFLSLSSLIFFFHSLCFSLSLSLLSHSLIISLIDWTLVLSWFIWVFGTESPTRLTAEPLFNENCFMKSHKNFKNALLQKWSLNAEPQVLRNLFLTLEQIARIRRETTHSELLHNYGHKAQLLEFSSHNPTHTHTHVQKRPYTPIRAYQSRSCRSFMARSFIIAANWLPQRVDFTL